MPGDKHSILTGTCLCGEVTISGSMRRETVEACHCTMCRNWAGGPFMGVQLGSDIEIMGEAHVGRYRSSEWAERGFCKRCGTHLFFRFIPAENYSVPAGLFAEAFAPLAEEIFIDEKPPYYSFVDGAHRKTGAQIIAEAEAAGFTFP